MENADRERREVHYSGSVQGVGFRYTARRIAAQFDVTGFVRNLPDGRVQLVVEGPKGELDRLLEEIERAMSGYIHDTEMQTSRAKGQFESFQIAF